MPTHRRLLNEVPGYAQARARIENRALAAARRGLRTLRGTVDIPVVAHIVWKTDAENISDDQIHSQIDVLNKDFRAQNPDIETCPVVFQSVIGDTRLQFHLATVHPDGNPTDGIDRQETTESSFTSDDKVKAKSSGGADPWPADHYLNIWVCNLQPWLGYAQFPGGPPETDGVVITHDAFGTTGTAAAPFDLGRTTTHEIGHWLDLYHIWGDDGTGCTGSDLVADTPNQGGPNYGSPGFPSISCDNGPNGDMFMNYMDYVDDDTMVMFSEGQVLRIDAALEGPRNSFLTGQKVALLQVGQTENTVTHKWHNVSFENEFSSQPLLLAAIETFHGPNTAGIRIQDLTKEEFSVRIEEEQSADREMSHTSEKVGYLGIEEGNLYDEVGNLIGEAGKLSVNQETGEQWRTVNLNNSYCNPVVIMQLMTYNGNNPAHTRIRNINDNSFEFQIEEWDYLDQFHLTEDIGYLVIEGRRHRMADGAVLEAGKIETDHNWVPVQFGSAFASSPVVLSHCQTYNGNQAVVTRNRNISGSGFDIRLQEEEANDGIHLKEIIGYVALENI
jgi:hypothetical protein